MKSLFLYLKSKLFSLDMYKKYHMIAKYLCLFYCFSFQNFVCEGMGRRVQVNYCFIVTVVNFNILIRFRGFLGVGVEVVVF